MKHIVSIACMQSMHDLYGRSLLAFTRPQLFIMFLCVNAFFVPRSPDCGVDTIFVAVFVGTDHSE